jgi:hypothetical protein
VPDQPLAAQPARLRNGQICPAELLVIDATSDDGIILEVVP